MRSRGQLSPEMLAGLSIDRRIDVICDQFEADWWSSLQPNLSDYLRFVDAGHRATLFLELLLVDWELRSHDVNGVEWQHYRDRFPQYAAQIEEARLRHRGLDPATSSTVIAPLSHVENYVLLEPIGDGSSGKVWKANDSVLGRTVAVKIPHTRQLSDNQFIRFLREGRAVAQLSHPGIVRVLEVGREGDVVYIVSDYVAGQNLRDWLLSSRPTPREAAGLCVQLADAIAHAHERGVIHRDLKPSNVIVDDQREPRITDFGLAKSATDNRDLTIEGEIVGTPAYMSPEQASGKSLSADRRTDVYSLGVIFYELLTGKAPFHGDRQTVMEQVLHKEPARPRTLQSHVPRDLETICLKAMAKSPNDRYWSAQELAVDLRRFLDGRCILARRLNAVERSWRWLRRKPSIAASLALCALLLLAVLLAQRIRAENHALLGLQTVNLSTHPAGARVAIVPLDKTTGDPIPEKVIQPTGRTPLRVELLPNDYLVVAALDDGRFHEVYRHVPRTIDSMPGSYRHLRWTREADGSLSLPDIIIPPAACTGEMALIEGLSGQFYIDCHEFTVAEYRRIHDGKQPYDPRWQSVPDNYALSATFDKAVSIAEGVGKRIPTVRELALATTFRTSQNNEPNLSDQRDPLDLGPVGLSLADRTATTPMVIGLGSNVTEWTVSKQSYEGAQSSQSARLLDVDDDLRIVFDGRLILNNIEQPITEEFSPDVSLFPAFSRFRMRPDIGFRCVRSNAPRFMIHNL